MKKTKHKQQAYTKRTKEKDVVIWKKINCGSMHVRPIETAGYLNVFSINDKTIDRVA